MKIAVFGLGYVGLTAAVCLAKQGHELIGVDISEEKVALANSGLAPLCEPGVGELLREAVAERRLSCTTDPTVGADAEMAIVCVGTPTGFDGSHDMSYVAEVSRQIAKSISCGRRRQQTVAYRSTVRPGTIEELVAPIFRAALGADSSAYELVYNPEFLREATAVKDFFDPPKIVVGTCDGEPNARMDAMNRGLKATVFYTKYREAEFTKFADNTFHALKVAFANELGRICRQLGVDVEEMHRIFVSDTKLNISPYYLRPGGAFGGSCLPKDVRALQHISGEVGANTHVIDSVIRSNDAQKCHIYQSCTEDLAPASRVLLLGLAFKAETDDLRESPYVYLARRLIDAGHRVSVYDPFVRPEALNGKNLGFAYTHLSTIDKLIVTREVVENNRFDLVIDAHRLSPGLSIRADRAVDLSKFA